MDWAASVECYAETATSWRARYTIIQFDTAGARHEIPHLLRKTAAYLEEGYYDLIHPSEKPKPRVLSKRQFNKLIKQIKEHNNKQLGQKLIKLPTFPKKKRPTLTKKLEVLYKKFNVSPFL